MGGLSQSAPVVKNTTAVEIKPEAPSGLESVTPLDLRTDFRMMMPAVDTTVWEKQLQQELQLIQKQQQIQKQLLITEFQKQHENLTRQHQAQLREHIKLQQELLAVKQQQELLEKERKLEQQRQEQEIERHRREQQFLILRNKDRSRESAVASTEVKQKLQEFLLSKSATKDPPSNGTSHSMGRHPKLWYTAAHHTSLDQSSPPLSGTSPTYKYMLPGTQEAKDDFPLRKTDTSVSSSAPGSGPSSPNSGSSGMGVENGSSVLPQVPHTEAATTLKEKHVDVAMQNMRHALPGHYQGGVPLPPGLPPVALEAKVNNSHQALLQHLLLKEQMRQQKILNNGAVPVHPQSPLTMKDRPVPSIRHKLPRHRPLNRTQSAPLPQGTLAQLVIQQQHQQFLEKQKQYQQQIQINKMLSKSIEQLRQPSTNLEESEEENHKDQPMQEDKAPHCGSIRNRNHNSSCTSSSEEAFGTHVADIKVKEEPLDSDYESLSNQSEASEQTAFMQQQLQLQEHQHFHPLRLYPNQSTPVGMTKPDKHQPASRTQSSPTASIPSHQLPEQPVTHAFTTGISPQKHFTVLPCGGLGVDSDTIWNELHSSNTARMAVGCVIELASKVASRELRNGFAVVRPPGHHAEESTAMGFCFFNSVAIAAKHLRQKLNINKVLIVDWDVHHGNGTQQAFFGDSSVLYISLHRYDEGNFFPGSGAPDECGSGPGEGYNVNIAWTGGLDPPMGDVEYLMAFRTVVIPIAAEFNPDVVLVSAGFDAVEGHDPPLGGYKVTAKCFGHLTKKLMKLANGRIVLALEGGHDLTAICDASEACVNALLGNELEAIPESILLAKPNENAVESIRKTIEIQSETAIEPMEEEPAL
ncbi:HDAC9 deacetylase, partial [Polypterus senegalus]